MNCADRLVALFGSQAEVARQFRLDRAVVRRRLVSDHLGNAGPWSEIGEFKVALSQPSLVAPAAGAVVAMSRPRGYFGVGRIHAMTTDEVQFMVRCFAECAETTMRSGTDGIELMFSYDTLVDAFFYDDRNLRTDAQVRPLYEEGGIFAMVGATGVGQIVEVVMQLRGEHPNLVKDACIGMTHNLGGTGVACTVHILGREA